MRHCKVDTELSILPCARRRRRCDTARRTRSYQTHMCPQAAQVRHCNANDYLPMCYRRGHMASAYAQLSVRAKGVAATEDYWHNYAGLGSPLDLALNETLQRGRLKGPHVARDAKAVNGHFNAGHVRPITQLQSGTPRWSLPYDTPSSALPPCPSPVQSGDGPSCRGGIWGCRI